MNNNIKKIIGPLITLLLVLAVFVFVNYINEGRKERLFDLRKFIATQRELPSVSDIDRRIVQISGSKKEIEEFLFDKDVPVVFIEDVEKIALNNDVEIFIENVQETQIKEINYLEMSTFANGQLENIINFIDDLENIKKDIKIQFLRIVKNETEESISWRADVILIGKTK